MIEKSFKLRNEENRLSTATQELATSLGDATYEMQIGTVRGLTSLTKGMVNFSNDAGTVGSYLGKVLSDTLDKIPAGEKNAASRLGGAAAEIFFGTGEIAGMFATSYAAGMLGNNELYGALGETIGDKWKNDFKDTKYIFSALGALADNNNKPQEVVVKIVGENIPQGISIKQDPRIPTSNRVSTVIAGRR